MFSYFRNARTRGGVKNKLWTSPSVGNPVRVRDFLSATAKKEAPETLEVESVCLKETIRLLELALDASVHKLAVAVSRRLGSHLRVRI